MTDMNIEQRKVDVFAVLAEMESDIETLKKNIAKIREDLPKVQTVVRCRECRNHHWHQEPCHGKTVHVCDVLDAEVPRDFFCGYGKRKAGDPDGLR